MGATTGILPINTYTQPLTSAIAQLLALIPDPDTTSTSGAQAGGGFLDQMSPAAATQLRVEIQKLADLVDGGADGVAFGTYTMVSADDSTGSKDIVTGLADTAANNYSVSIWRSGSIVISDQVISEPSPGTLRIADGSTYKLTAGDIVVWFAIDPAS
jgi:hypothetical protein